MRQSTKHAHFWSGVQYPLTENRLRVCNEMWCAADIHNYKCHIWAKEFLDSNFNLAVNDKMSNFSQNSQISHFHKNRNVLKYYWNFFRPTASTLWILWHWHVRNLLFKNFCRCTRRIISAYSHYKSTSYVLCYVLLHHFIIEFIKGWQLDAFIP